MDGIDSDEELLHLLERDPVLSPPVPLPSPDTVAAPIRQKTPTTPLPEMLRCMNISSSLAQRSSTPLSLGSSPSVSRSSRTFRPSYLTQHTTSKLANAIDNIETSDNDTQNVSTFSQNSRTSSRDGLYSDQHNSRKNLHEFSPITPNIPRNISSYPQDKSHPSYLSRSRSRSSLSSLSTSTNAGTHEHVDIAMQHIPSTPSHTPTQLHSHTPTQLVAVQRNTAPVVIRSQLQVLKHSRDGKEGRANVVDGEKPEGTGKDKAEVVEVVEIGKDEVEVVKKVVGIEAGNTRARGGRGSGGVVGEDEAEVDVDVDVEVGVELRGEGEAREKAREEAREVVREVREEAREKARDAADMRSVVYHEDQRKSAGAGGGEGDGGAGGGGEGEGDVEGDGEGSGSGGGECGGNEEEYDDDDESAGSDFSQTSRHSQYSRISKKSQVSQKSGNSGNFSFPRSENSGKMGFSGYSGHISRLPAPRRQAYSPDTPNIPSEIGNLACTKTKSNTNTTNNINTNNNTNTNTNTNVCASAHRGTVAQSNTLTSVPPHNNNAITPPQDNTITPPHTNAMATSGSGSGSGGGSGVPVRALTMETLLLFDAMNGRKEEEKREREKQRVREEEERERVERREREREEEMRERERKERDRKDREKARFEREQREKEREKEEEKLLSHSGNITQTPFIGNIGLSGIDLSEIAGIRKICGISIPVGPETARLCVQEERTLQLLQVTEARLSNVKKKLQQRGQEGIFVDEGKLACQERGSGINDENSGCARKNGGHSSNDGEEHVRNSRKTDISEKNQKFRNASTPSRIPLPPRNTFSPNFPIPNTTSPVSMPNNGISATTTTTTTAAATAYGARTDLIPGASMTHTTPVTHTVPVTHTTNPIPIVNAASVNNSSINSGITNSTATALTGTVTNSNSTITMSNSNMNTSNVACIVAGDMNPNIQQTYTETGNFAYSGKNMSSQIPEIRNSPSGYAFAHAFGKGHGTENGFDHRIPDAKLRNHKGRGYGDKYRSKSRKKRENPENIQNSREPRNSRSHSRPVSTVLGASTRPPSTVSSSESSLPETGISTNYTGTHFSQQYIPTSTLKSIPAPTPTSTPTPAPASAPVPVPVPVPAPASLSSSVSRIGNTPSEGLEVRQRPMSAGTNTSGISLRNNFSGKGIGISNSGKGPRPHSAVVGKNTNSMRDFSGMQIPESIFRPVSAVPTAITSTGMGTGVSSSTDTGTGMSIGMGKSTFTSVCNPSFTGIPSSTSTSASGCVPTRPTPVQLHGGSYAAHHYTASQRSYGASSRGDAGIERAQARVKAKKKVIDSRNGVTIVKMDVHEVQRSIGGYTPIE